MKYLDPKADLTFKKVFGGHTDLVISFLNAMLPFEKQEEEITWVEYLDPELVPVNPFRKDSIVDVRCRDREGRQFRISGFSRLVEQGFQEYSLTLYHGTY